MGFKELLNKIKNVDKKTSSTLKIYNEILETINGLEVYRDEIRKLKGHTHFAVVEAEEKILKLWKKYWNESSKARIKKSCFSCPR